VIPQNSLTKCKFIQHGLPVCSATLAFVSLSEFLNDLPAAAGFHLFLALASMMMILLTYRRNKPQCENHTFLLCSFFAITGQFYLAPQDPSIPIWIGVFPIIFIFAVGVLRGTIWSVLLFTIFSFRMYLYPKAANTFGISDYIFANTSLVFLLMIIMAFLFEKISTEYQFKLDYQAKTDYLTGIHNRRAINSVLQKETLRSKLEHESIALLLIDIDHFKKVNDNFGHAMGDEVLCATTTIIQNQIRDADFVFRWGGEEFLVLLPGTKLSRAQLVAERIRSAVETWGHSKVGRLTISIGVSTMSTVDDFDRYLRKTDSALYQAKKSGRNRVELAGEPKTMQTIQGDGNGPLMRTNKRGE